MVAVVTIVAAVVDNGGVATKVGTSYINRL